MLIVTKTASYRANARGGGRRTRVHLNPPEIPAETPKTAALTLIGVKSLPTILLGEGMPAVVGSTKPYDVIIKDPEISRAHLSITVEDREVSLSNLGDSSVLFGGPSSSKIELKSGRQRIVELEDYLDILMPLSREGRTWAKENAPRYLRLQLMPWLEGVGENKLLSQSVKEPKTKSPYRSREIVPCAVSEELAPFFNGLIDIKVLEKTEFTEYPGSFEVLHRFMKLDARLRIISWMSSVGIVTGNVTLIGLKVGLVVVGVAATLLLLALSLMCCFPIGLLLLILAPFTLMECWDGFSDLLGAPLDLVDDLKDSCDREQSHLLQDFKKIFATLPEKEQALILAELGRGHKQLRQELENSLLSDATDKSPIPSPVETPLLQAETTSGDMDKKPDK
jgi:hypothetical protein